jgi:hypothetical protein
MKYGFGFRYWREPTPTKIRRVFGAISSAGIASCGFAILREHYGLAIFFLVCASGGAFVSKLFAEKP